MTALLLPARRNTLRDKVFDLNWTLILLLSLIAAIGVATLYSVGMDAETRELGSWTPWAARHGMRFLVGLGLLFVIGLISLRFWMAIAYPAYVAVLGMLFAVPIIGETSKGAQRWLEIAGFQVQPSEFMKIAVVLALARYYHSISADRVSNPFYMIPPLLIIGLPTALVFKQPDLGTAILIAATGLSVVFLAGISWRIVAAGLFAGVVGVWGALRFGVLKPYQLERVLTFLNPDRDPLGKGYHLLQSKIALGSGGVSGKGYLQGTQAGLDFLPEKHTDFIFTIFGEQFGLVGAAILIVLYLGVFLVGVQIASNSSSHFGRLMAMGVCVTFIMYALINTGMVMGLAPVVGVPLPLVSNGGTVMLTILAGFGLVMSVHVHRDADTLKSAELQ